jgi:hypothetical protein
MDMLRRFVPSPKPEDSCTVRRSSGHTLDAVRLEARDEVQNPSTPAEIAVPIVRLLLRHDLVEVVRATHVPSIVRAAAVELVARRPPVPEGSGSVQ